MNLGDGGWGARHNSIHNSMFHGTWLHKAYVFPPGLSSLATSLPMKTELHYKCISLLVPGTQVPGPVSNWAFKILPNQDLLWEDFHISF